jgi:hypothetical protein
VSRPSGAGNVDRRREHAASPWGQELSGPLATETGDLVTARDLCQCADRRMEAASHFITEHDRTDAHAVRRIA